MGRTDGQTDGRTDGLTDGWTDGQGDDYMLPRNFSGSIKIALLPKHLYMMLYLSYIIDILIKKNVPQPNLHQRRVQMARLPFRRV